MSNHNFFDYRRKGLPRAGSRGFTLIELLIVIGIIILLAALVIVYVNKSRAKGRDAKRISDLSTIQLALEMYRDKNQSYPVTGTNSWVASGATGCASGSCEPVKRWWNGTDGLDLDDPNYLGPYLFPLPHDPKDISPSYYWYAGNATDYKLMAVLEDDDARMSGDGGKYTDRYELFTLGAQGW